MEPRSPASASETREEQPLSETEELFWECFSDSFEFLSSVRYEFEEIKSPCDGTGQWFFNTPMYQKWCMDDQRILLPKGSPGCGKSVLMRAVSQEPDLLPASDCKSRLILRYFFSNADKARQTFQGFLKSISFQLFQYAIFLRRDLLRDFVGRGEALQNGSADFQDRATAEIADQCRGIILKILSQTGPAVLFVDGLDNCRDNAELEMLLKFLEQSTAIVAKYTFRVCISARNYPVIDSTFLNSAVAIDMDQYNPEDISLYVKKSLDVPGSDTVTGTMVALQQNIISEAKGCFRLAESLVQLVKTRKRSGIKEELDFQRLLDGALRDVSDLWGDVLDKIDPAYRDKTLCVFNSTAISAEDDKFEAFEVFTRLLMAWTGGLLYITEPSSVGSRTIEGYVKFVNSTIGPFLRSRDTGKLIGGPDSSLLLPGHQYLVRACIRALEATLEDKREDVIRGQLQYLRSLISTHDTGEVHGQAELNSQQKSSFFAYATEFIFRHSKEVDDGNGSLGELVTCMLGDGSARAGLYVAWAILMKKPRKFIRFAAQLHLRNTIIRTLIHHKVWASEIEQGVENEPTALYWAVHHGDWMLSLRIAQTSVKEELLQREARNKWKNRKSYLKQTDTLGRTPLHLAAIGGHKRIVEDLLFWDRSTKATIRRDVRNGVAASQQHLDAVEGLTLEKDNSGYTALHHAVLEGHADVVGILLDVASELTGATGSIQTLEEQAIQKSEETLDKDKKESYEDIVPLLKAKEFAALGLEDRQTQCPAVDSQFSANLLYCIRGLDLKGFRMKKRKMLIKELISHDILDLNLGGE